MAAKSLQHKGRGKQFVGADESLNTWINHYNDITFKCNGVYHGVVETIQSKGAATVVIGEKERGIPLLWNDDWSNKKVKFAKVLLLIDRLRPTADHPEYDKDTRLSQVIREGEFLFVVVEEARKIPDNVFKYFARKAFKMEDARKIMDASSMMKIRDPLKGVVESFVSKNVGIIRFGTYSGSIAKALFRADSFHIPGGNSQENASVASLVPVHSMVYLEVKKWHGGARAQEWEKLLLKDGILFHATKVWRYNDSRAVGKGSDNRKVGSNSSEKDKIKRHESSSMENFSFPLDSSVRKYQLPSSRLTDVQAYYGIVEIITSGICAIVCTAHRGGEPLTWVDNWFSKGVILERVLLLSERVRLSKNDGECAKGTPIKMILQNGDRVMVVVEPTSQEKCYKWFAKTCWKVSDEVDIIPKMPLNLLSDHLCGVVDSLISHDLGIIQFETFHGHSANAFFNHECIFKDGRKILPHIPLGSELKKGARVHLIVDKWYPGKNFKEKDGQLLEKNVQYRVVVAWEIGTSRPTEEASYTQSMKDEKLFRPPPLRVPSPFNQEAEGTGTTFKKPLRGGKHFTGTRECKQGERSKMRAKHSKQEQNIAYSGNFGDGFKNDTDSNFSDSLSDLCDFLGAHSVSTENLSSVYGFQEPYDLVSNMSQGNVRGEELQHLKKSENSKTIIDSPSIDSSARPPLDVSPYPSKNVKSYHVDGTHGGTLVSVDESWGLVQFNEDEVLDFQSNTVYMYGLKLEGIPLQKLFHEGQKFKVHLEGGKVTAMEYGIPQLPNQMRKAILVYCENNSIPEDIRAELECIMKQYGV